jgi:hypothetical protein
MTDRLPIKRMIDSGAYTVWRRSNRVIDIDRYCDYLIAKTRPIWAYVALDVIPGTHGGRYIPGDYERAADASSRNYEHMRSRGLDPTPVCHEGEDWRSFDRYVNAGATYIGLSTSTNFGKKDQRSMKASSVASTRT